MFEESYDVAEDPAFPVIRVICIYPDDDSTRNSWNVDTLVGLLSFFLIIALKTSNLTVTSSVDRSLLLQQYKQNSTMKN